MTELTIPKHLYSISDCGDCVVEAAREMLCIVRDEEFEADEYPAVNFYFKRYADCKKVVDCLNERYGGVAHNQIIIGIYH